MASTQETQPLLEKSVIGSDANLRLSKFAQVGMKETYQRLYDDFALLTKFVPVETVDYETWEQWIYQNNQSDGNTLEPHPHVVGTSFPLSSIEEPNIQQFAMSGYGNHIHIPAGYWRFRKGPEDPIARAREITLGQWNDFFSAKVITDLVYDFTITADAGEFDAYIDNGTGGAHATYKFLMAQPDVGYEFDETDGDPLNFFLDVAACINSQHKIRSLSGSVPMKSSRCVVILSELALAKIKKKFANDKLYFDRVSIGNGITVPEVGGFTFLSDDAALGALSKTYNGTALTTGFGLVFQPSRVPFYAKQYFLGAKGWNNITLPNPTTGFGMEYYLNSMREGDVELLYQAYFKTVLMRPDELMVLGNLMAD